MVGAGDRRNEGPGEGIRTNSSDGVTLIFKSHDLNGVPRVPWGYGAGGRVSVHRFRQHHRLLRHLRSCHGNGTHLRPSLRRKTIQNAGLNPPENRPPPPLHLHPHLPRLAQHEVHTLMVWTRPPDILHRTNLHPLFHPRPLPPLPPPPPIYLRTQSITLPLTYCSALSLLLHLPLNFLLVVHFKMGVSGVAIAMVWTNLNLFLFLSSFVYFSGVYKDSWVPPAPTASAAGPPYLHLRFPRASLCASNGGGTNS